MPDDLASALTRWRKAEQAATKGPWQVTATQEGDEVIYVHASGRHGSVSVLFETDPGREADAEFIAVARNAVPRFLAAIEAVLKLHRPVDRGRVMRCCDGCEEFEDHEDCCHEWPCPTVEDITAALTGETADAG